MEYKNSQRGLLWIIQLISACSIVVWLLNPASKNIIELTVLAGVWLLITAIKYGKVLLGIFSNINMLKPFLFILVLLLYRIVGHAEMSLSYMVYFVCMIIGLVYISNNDKTSLLIISIVALAYLLIITISTLMAYQVKPGISRVLAYGDPEMIKYYGGASYVTPFIAGYAGIYVLNYIIPALDYGRRQSRSLYKALFICLSILYSVLVIRSQYFIAIMIWLISIVQIFLGYKKNLNQIIKFTLVLMVND